MRERSTDGKGVGAVGEARDASVTGDAEISALRQREMLVVMTALSFIENHALLSDSQIRDARRSLHALFIRSTGEETMLRKLIEIVRAKREVQAAFGDIARITDGVSTSTQALTRRVQDFRTALMALQPSPEEARDFVAPLISYAQRFVDKVLQFERLISLYLHLREEQARRVYEFEVAQDASERLRKRLLGLPTGQTVREADALMREQLLDSFDLGGTRAELVVAQRESAAMAERIVALLRDMRAMAELAVPPQTRGLANFGQNPVSSTDDVYLHFSTGMRRHPRMQDVRDVVLEHFRLFNRSHGVFSGDFERLVRAAGAIAVNPKDYFDARQEDTDIRAKRKKLQRFEGLLPFLEQAGRLIADAGDISWADFSSRMSELIDQRPSDWSHVTDDLLVAKVRAEAEMHTRTASS